MYTGGELNQLHAVKKEGEGSFHRINACMHVHTLVEQSSEREDKMWIGEGGVLSSAN